MAELALHGSIVLLLWSILLNSAFAAILVIGESGV